MIFVIAITKIPGALKLGQSGPIDQFGVFFCQGLPRLAISVGDEGEEYLSISQFIFEREFG